MPYNRFYINSPLDKGGIVSLLDEEARHLIKVMRVQEKETVELINGKNLLATAKVHSIKKNEAQLLIQEVETRSATDYTLILCQAIPRLNRLDTIIEKATELGAHEIWLFAGERSEKKQLTSHQMERLTSISIAAMKQCGRWDLPKLVLKPPIKNWETLILPAFFGDVEPEAPLLPTVLKKKEQGVLFFVGPESGFTLNEEKKLQQLGAVGVKLHSNTLRTDTASIVALSLIFGNFYC